jgi:hypothetical protein
MNRQGNPLLAYSAKAGGAARAATLSPGRRAEIARAASRARWKRVRAARVVVPILVPRVTPLIDLDPQAIRIEPIPQRDLVDLQARMSRAVWRPCGGRRLSFTVTHGDALLGLVFLASPVIKLTVRDQAMQFPDDPRRRGSILRRYADLSVCVAAQPIGWHWNLGKLCALLATTLGDVWTEAYDDPLLGIFTTSLWGRSVQYNRIYQYLGLTKGFGHEHVSESEYRAMLKWMAAHSVEVPSCGHAAGSNPRMRRIQAYRKASGDHAVTVFHGQQRGVYYAPARPDRETVIREWFERWGHPRYLRTRDLPAPYQSGLEDSATIRTPGASRIRKAS